MILLHGLVEFKERLNIYKYICFPFAQKFSIKEEDPKMQTFTLLVYKLLNPIYTHEHAETYMQLIKAS